MVFLRGLSTPNFVFNDCRMGKWPKLRSLGVCIVSSLFVTKTVAGSKFWYALRMKMVHAGDFSIQASTSIEELFEEMIRSRCRRSLRFLAQIGFQHVSNHIDIQNPT